jgi:hypothetical protein
MNRKWSNSSNGLLRYSANRMNNSGLYFGPTQGLSSPKNSQRGCLCPDRDLYLRECCDGSLQAQGVGVIQGVIINAYTSTGFSNGFSLGFKRFINE